MGHLWRNICGLHFVHDPRALARPAEAPKGNASIVVSQGECYFPYQLPTQLTKQWLLSRQQRAIHDPRYRDPVPFYTTYRPQQYGMEAFPPPVYDPNSAPPPKYQPPQGGSKVDPSQWRAEPTRRPTEAGEPAPDYTAPLGPPPAAHLHTTATGSSSTSNNPYRL
jgi:hypothetical protein